MGFKLKWFLHRKETTFLNVWADFYCKILVKVAEGLNTGSLII